MVRSIKIADILILPPIVKEKSLNVARQNHCRAAECGAPQKSSRRMAVRRRQKFAGLKPNLALETESECQANFSNVYRWI